MFDKKPICYAARGMTGRPAYQVVAEAKRDKEFLEKCGFEVLCPVSKEGVKPSKKPINSPKELMDTFWAVDKAMIKQAHIVFNFSPHLPSIGVIREHGLARYCYWKKVITVFPTGLIPADGAICHYEDDFVTDSLVIAVGEALRTHGSWWQRFKWRLSLLNRSLLGWLWLQFKELWR